MTFSPFDADELFYLIGAVYKDRDARRLILSKYGEVFKENEVGTCFLYPADKRLSLFWLHFNSEEQIDSFGIAILESKLTLKGVVRHCQFLSEEYNKYDDRYELIFSSKTPILHNLKIPSHKRFSELAEDQFGVHEL